MTSFTSSSSASQVFHLADFVLYLEKFPVLKDKRVIGTGCYSHVFEGETPDTVLKLTCDEVYCEFIRQWSYVPGVPTLYKDYGSVETADFSQVSLFAIERLKPLAKWDHDHMILERDALSKAISFKIAVSEIDTGMMPCQVAHARALGEIRESRMFSESVGSALFAISNFMEQTELDVLLDLGNPNNFMTNGRQLIITDPLMLVT